MAYEQSAHVQAQFRRQRAALRAEMEPGLAEVRASLERNALAASAYLAYTTAEDEAKALQAEMGPGFLVLARRGQVSVTPLVLRYPTSAEARQATEARISLLKQQTDREWAERESRRAAQLTRERAARAALTNTVSSDATSGGA